MSNNLQKRTQNINQALVAAMSSIKLARKLLRELENDAQTSSRELPGEFGLFDGHSMVMEDGDKYQVPENYASKSRLVYGDRLKKIERNGRSLYKQVDRVKREKAPGILTKKDGKWNVVTSHGSFEVLAAAVNYWKGEEGDETVVIIPRENKQAPFAALEKVIREEDKDKEKEPDVEKQKGIETFQGEDDDENDDSKEKKSIEEEKETNGNESGGGS